MFDSMHNCHRFPWSSRPATKGDYLMFWQHPSCTTGLSAFFPAQNIDQKPTRELVISHDNLTNHLKRQINQHAPYILPFILTFFAQGSLLSPLFFVFSIAARLTDVWWRFSHFILSPLLLSAFFQGFLFLAFPQSSPNWSHHVPANNTMNCFSFLHVFPPCVFSFNCELFKRLGFLNCWWQKTTLCLCWPVTVIYWALNGAGPSPGWDQNPSHTGAQKNNLLSKHICLQKLIEHLPMTKNKTLNIPNNHEK